MAATQIHPTVGEFMVNFSRFEYALKRAGFVTPRGNRGDAQVDWPRFEKRYAAHYEAAIEKKSSGALSRAFKLFAEDPPRILVLADRDGGPQLSWKRTIPEGETIATNLSCVRRVRNNLFHGDKPETLVGGSERGLDLVRSSLEVLDICILLDAEVHRFFTQYAPPLPRLDDEGKGAAAEIGSSQDVSG